MNRDSVIFEFLTRLRQRARGTLLIWAAAALLTGMMLCGASRLGWIAWGVKGGLAALAAALLLASWWVRRIRRLSPTDVARDLDRRWNLQSHLESATNLAVEDSVWANAQREDAAKKLRGRKPPGALPWIAGLVLGAVALCFLGIEGGAVAWQAWGARTVAPAPAAIPPAAPAPVAPPAASPPAKATIHASVVWKSPEDQIKATAIEEVPLVAYSESDSGLRSVSLRYTVNGGSEGSVVLDADALGASAAPGGHELKPSLYLDELKVKEFDVVAYHLVGELNGPAPASVASPLQFIQIRKTQADMEVTGGAGNGRLVSMIRGLEIAQMELIRRNFGLIYSPEGQASPNWALGNRRAGSDQSDLAGTAAEARQLAVTQQAPDELVGDLEKAGLAMKEASGKIDARENGAGATAQNRALALVVACEKFIDLGTSGAAISSPFKDDQQFTLPDRPTTPAGKLEQLATRQQQSNQGSGAADAKGQEAIAKDAKKLDEAGGLEPQVQNLLHAGAAAAADAAKQLALNDATTARFPAAQAERKFHEAVAAQEKSGRARASALLESARRTLNAAGRERDSSARKAQLLAIRQDLRSSALEEEQTGSGDAAQALAALAAAFDAPAVKGGSHSSEPYTQARSRELADVAARTQVGLISPGVALDRTIRQLNLIGQSGAPGPGPAPGPDLLANLEMSSQTAEWTVDDADTVGLAQKTARMADSLQQSRPSEVGLAGAVRAATDLAAALVRGRRSPPGKEIVRRFKPDDVDPLYRPAVETYFEHLSRDSAGAQPAGPK